MSGGAAAATVIGLGQHKGARDIIEKLDREIRGSRGIARTIIAQAGDVELTAQRQDFDKDFQSFTFRFKGLGGDSQKSLEEAAAGFPGTCTTKEEDGWYVVRCEAEAAAEITDANNAADKVSGCVKLPEVWRIRGDNFREDRLSIDLLFRALVQYKASDVHITAGESPIFRIDGEARRSDLMGALSISQIYDLIREICGEQEWELFSGEGQVSFSFHQVGMGYGRVSAFMKAGTPHIALRHLPEIVPSFDQLNLPKEAMDKLADARTGLVLVSGATGTGKTTTVAAIMDYINTNKSGHILSIEDPIEYVHRNKKGIVSQRAIGKDVPSFSAAVSAGMRQDPNVLVISEMRDAETIRAAIGAAGTGLLVISTVQSNTAYEVLNRIVSFFPPAERDLIRVQLRDTIRAVVCQRLVPKIGGGRIPALEMLVNDITPINTAIKAGDIDGVKVGMQQKISHSYIFETSLEQLYKKGEIDLDHAKAFSTDYTVLEQMVMGTYTVPRLESVKESARAQHARAHGD